MPLPIRRLAATALLAILVLPPAEPARAGICDGAVTQLQINECFHQKFLKADRKLNKAWPGAQRRAERMGTGAALRDAQRKWIAFRDATCSAEARPLPGRFDAGLGLVRLSRAADQKAYKGPQELRPIAPALVPCALGGLTRREPVQK